MHGRDVLMVVLELVTLSGVAITFACELQIIQAMVTNLAPGWTHRNCGHRFFAA